MEERSLLPCEGAEGGGSSLSGVLENINVKIPCNLSYDDTEAKYATVKIVILVMCARVTNTKLEIILFSGQHLLWLLFCTWQESFKQGHLTSH